MSDKKILSRKDFLKLSGIATGGIALTATMFNHMFGMSEKTIRALKNGPGIESWRVTACRICPGGCSLSVRRIDGVPIGIKGNPSSPINRGGLCPAAQANLEILYHPDRFTRPLARPEGPLRKELTSVEWNDIIPSVAKNISELITRKQPYKIAVINGDNSPIMREVWQNFANALGTPNFYQDDYCGINDNASFVTQGFREIPRLDLINSESIISFGSNFCEEEGAPVHYNQVLSRFKDLGNITRNKLIYVGPRANITAASAHKWIPMKPDTYGILALGIVHILIEENGVEIDNIRKSASGYADWTDESNRHFEGFETQVRTDFHPKKVEEITGVPEKDIRYLAELLMTRKRSIVLCGNEAARTPRGDLHQWAVHCLNFITGNIQQPGAMYFNGEVPAAKFDTVSDEKINAINLFKTDENNPLEKPSLDIFAKRVEGYTPYKLELLIINKANPAYFGENPAKWKATLKHIPRVVFIGDLPNETSEHVDVILPCHSEMESWDLVEDIPTLSFDSATLQRAVIKPMYDTKQSYDILYSIVSGVTEMADFKFPAATAKKMVQKRLVKIHSGGKGTLFKKLTTEEWLETYRRHKPVKDNYSKKEFMNGILKSGGWWWPAALSQKKLSEILDPVTGKFDFLNVKLRYFEGTADNDTQILKDIFIRMNYPKNMQRYSLTGEDGFPLTLISGFPITNPYGRTVYSPTLLETIGALREIYWESWVEINPVTAAKYRVKDGEMIQIDSQVGQIQARARVRPIIHPEMVFVPMGLGRSNVGRFGSGVGSNARQLMAPQPDISTGSMIFSGTPVRITLL